MGVPIAYLANEAGCSDDPKAESDQASFVELSKQLDLKSSAVSLLEILYKEGKGKFLNVTS